VSEDQLTYYEVVTKAILGSDSSVMKVLVILMCSPDDQLHANASIRNVTEPLDAHL